MNRLLLIILFSFGLIGASQAATLNIYVEGRIQPGSLQEGINTLHTAKSGDNINLFIDSPGGRMSEALNFLKAMRYSKAKTITAIVDHEAMSAAEDIMIASDKIKIADNARVLFHLGSLTDESGNRIVLSKDTDISLLDKSDLQYLKSITHYMLVTGKLLGLSTVDLHKMMIGEEGLILTGKEFKQRDPSLKGLRGNAAHDREVDILDSLEEK